MVYTGQPSKGCATCRKRRIKCDEKTPECGNCLRIKQNCPGYLNQFDLAWRDQTTVAKRSVERGKQKRKAARELAASASTASGSSQPSTSVKDVNDKSSLAGTSKNPVDKSSDLISPRSSRPPRLSASYQGLISSGPQRPTTPPGTDPYLSLRVPKDDHILTFFLNVYILPVRDRLARRGLLEYLTPMYRSADPESLFMLSTMAFASCMLSNWTGYDSFTTVSRSFYLRAVKSIRDQVSERKSCASDEILIAVLLLQLYEVCIGRMAKQGNVQHAHLNGALALIRHRGASNFKGKVSLAILLYVRSLAVEEALRTNTAVPHDVSQWSEFFDESEQIPGVRLDGINLDLANLRSAASLIFYEPQHGLQSQASANQQILAAAIGIEYRLKGWLEAIPKSWIPIRVFGDQFIAPSIKEAGLYQPHCDVYPTLFLALMWNRIRLSLIETNSLILLCLDREPTSMNPAQQEACRSNIQYLVDDVCAGVPFLLGDRMEPDNPGNSAVQYPRAPGRPPVRDHYQTGPTMGGWSIIAHLGAILRLDIQMREGQRPWIVGQLARTAHIYKIGKLPSQSP